MASSFPGAIDSFTDPLSGSALNSPSHSAQHADLNDAAEKIETYMGLVKVIPTGATNGTVGATGTVTVGNAVSSVTVSGVFSSLYDNYKIIFSGGSGTVWAGLQFKLGATATGYYAGRQGITYAGVNASAATANGTSFPYVGYIHPNGSQVNLDIFNANLSTKTFFSCQPVAMDTGGEIFTAGGFLNDNTSYTAFTLTTTSGTFTGGTIRIYGYRN
jgi:hypothetical protein